MKQTEVKIRRAKKEDINHIFEIGTQLEEVLRASKQKSGHFHEKSEFKEFIKHPKDNVLLVAESNKKVIGFIYAKIISKDWCMLDNLAVRKGYRDHGIGSGLVDELYKMLKKEKVDYVQVLVNAKHQETINFWKSKGFKIGKTLVWEDRWLK